MDFEDLIHDALCNPPHLINYEISRRLAKRFPDKVIIEGEDSSFDIEQYARGGQCSIVRDERVRDERVHGQFVTARDGARRTLRREIPNAWLNVLWRGRLFDVLFVSFDYSRYHLIIADAREEAEEFFRAVCDWCEEVRGEVLVFENGGWRKDDKLFASIKAADFDSIILPAELKTDLQRDLTNFFASRELYERYGVAWKRGALLIGPPGNGKTQTVRALIKQFGKPCLYVKSFKSERWTDERNMRHVFLPARKVAPCVVVMEDLDSLITERNRAFFLNELDGLDDNTGVVVLATTNHPGRLDPAILERPSRFDRKYFFELPAAAERAAYIEAWNRRLENEMRLHDDALPQIVAATEGFSFAYLKEMFVNAMTEWVINQAAPQSLTVAATNGSATRTTMSFKAVREENSMARLILRRAESLRERMRLAAKKAKAQKSEESDNEADDD